MIRNGCTYNNYLLSIECFLAVYFSAIHDTCMIKHVFSVIDTAVASNNTPRVQNVEINYLIHRVLMVKEGHKVKQLLVQKYKRSDWITG